MESNKERYVAYCSSEPLMPVMFQPWWLEAVCAGKEWDVLLFTESDLSGKRGRRRSVPNDERDGVREGGIDGAREGGKDGAREGGIGEDDKVVAAMPYLIRKRWWMRYVIMPQMTQFGGVWMSASVHADPDMQKRLAGQIKDRLKALGLHYYYQQYPVGSPLPHWLEKERMKVTKRVTYRIDNLSDMETVVSRFSQNKKRQLKKASCLELDTSMSAEEFFRFHSTCMKEKRRELKYTREFLLVLERKAQRAGACCFIRLYDPTIETEANADTFDVRQQQTLAAAFLVWDKQHLYYLIPAFRSSRAKSGASARLALEAMLEAQRRGLQFDFEGGNDSGGIANHYKQFGATPTTYMSVTRLYRPLFGLVLRLNKWVEKIRRF